MKPDAEVRVPAETAYVAVVRMATAGIAARLDFTLDDIEDLRMAVNEACAMVLARARPEADLIASYRLSPERIDVRIAAESEQATPPDPESFAWQVLSTTARDVRAEAVDGLLVIHLAVARDPAPASGTPVTSLRG
ncbi:ATP-binding protein [Marmoricola sp. RAF53]|uniref:ATP-binding protein n=1 Tax=Marmoricola sp. RAF53 TaxID=3233059 RepID=UPI003F948C56